MKKLFALIVAIVYLGSTVGATVHLHYCMDELINWSLSDNGGNKCDNCGMEKDGNCCKDENKFVKNNSDQSITGAIQILQASSPGSSISFINTAGNHSLSLINEYPVSHAPPGNSGIDILIHNCVFRI